MFSWFNIWKITLSCVNFQCVTSFFPAGPILMMISLENVAEETSSKTHALIQFYT